MRSRRLPGMPVLTLDTGVTIGRIARNVVDPDQKRVAALLVSLPRWWTKRFLPIESVHAFGGHAVTVGSAEALIPLKQDDSLAVLLYEKRIPLLGSPVVTAGGELIGTVRDYEIERTGNISSLYVTEGMWRSLTAREHSVPGSALLALGKDAVIVTEETWTLIAQQTRDKEAKDKGREDGQESDEASARTNLSKDGANLIRIATQRVRARLTSAGGEPANSSTEEDQQNLPGPAVTDPARPTRAPFEHGGDSPPDRK